jgi:hypothetical protein
VPGVDVGLQHQQPERLGRRDCHLSG